MQPSSKIRTFTEPDEYAAAIRGATSEVTIIGRGRFSATIATLDLVRLRVQQFSDNLPRVAHSVALPGLSTLAFRTRPGPSLLRGGVEMLPTNLIRRALNESYYHRSAGSAAFAAMSLPEEDFASFGAAISGAELAPVRDPVSVTPSAFAMAKLQHLTSAAGHLAESAPMVIAVPEAAYGLEQALIEAMINCLGTGEIDADRSALRQHALIMRRFRRLMEENPDQALFIPEICQAIGTSERTLRECCQEQLGVSPKRYLLTRRMHLVRRALRESAPTATTVTEVCTRYGFWELGRLSGQYKSLFGELPSTTLARPP